MAKHKRHGGGGALYNPRQVLSGGGLRRGARALTRLTIKPQTGAYRRLSAELRGEQGAEALGLAHLGQRTTGTVSDTYRNLAQSQAEEIARQSALGGLLQQNVGSNVQASQAALQGQQGGELGSYLQSAALRGAPGGGVAQQQLAALVAAQSQRQAGDSVAQQNFAASQAGSFSGLQAGMASASQMQGATAQADIQRDTANRIAESDLKYGQDIREAQGKLAEAKALKGSTQVQNLTTLREQERNYLLGKAATRQRAQAAKLGAQTSAAQLAEAHRHNVAGERTARQNARTSRQRARTYRYSTHHPHSSGSSGSGPGHHHNLAEKAILNSFHNVSGVYGNIPKSGSRRYAAFIQDVQQDVGADAPNRPWVREMIKQLAHKKRKHQGK